ncbi:hypothetical protein [Spirillospora sp. CA-294931]|uniref:hypothetical protein n=1 Tax=Spirillospora sp. CA-294931 TaxID=3240042 RepID=UPI003D8E911B
MQARLTLDIPTTVTSRYLVANPNRVRLTSNQVRKALPSHPLASTAASLLGSSRLTIESKAAQPDDRLKRIGAAPEQSMRLLNAGFHSMITGTSPPSAQPSDTQAFRLVARTLATQTGGLLVDLDSNQLLRPGVPEPHSFLLGHEWIGVFIEMDTGGLIRTDTSGLHRFGLPELAAREVPYGTMLTAANLLRGTAFRLFTEYRDHLARNRSTWEIATERQLDPADTQRFWGTRPTHTDPLPIRLTPTTTTCPGCTKALAISPTTPHDPFQWWQDQATPRIPQHPTTPTP